MSDFEGRTVVVTGAGSGIGLSMVAKFLERGATVVAADVSTDRVPEQAIAVRVDVSSAEDVRAMAEVAATTGRIDVLCNNAGIASTTDVLACSEEEWDRVFSVNVKGVFLATKAVLPHMLERNSGVIINTTSAAAFKGLKDRAAYCASKGAVASLTRQVAVQYAPEGVRCCAIAPGTVDSPWVGRLLDDADDPEAARAALVARQALGRLATADEVAAAALYLASDEAAFITGSELVIDGGFLA